MKDMGRKFNTTPGGIHIYIHHPSYLPSSPSAFQFTGNFFTTLYIHVYIFFFFLPLLLVSPSTLSPCLFYFCQKYIYICEKCRLGTCTIFKLKIYTMFPGFILSLYKFVQIYISILLFALRRINHGKKICIIASTNGHQEP